MKNITMKQLRGFVAVAAERSFTRAAGRLHISPSALTIAIQDLENEAGLPLFDRTTRSVELTAQGATFLPVAARLLDDLARGLQDLEALAEHRVGLVAVAASASFIDVVLAPAVAAMAKRHPGISVRVLEGAADTVINRVRNGGADFGVATASTNVEGLESQLLLEDRIGLLCPRGHPLATRQKAPIWSDIKQYSLAALESGSGIRVVVDHYPQLAGVLPKPMYEVSSVESLVSLVGSGVGVAILPALVASAGSSKNLVFRPLTRPALLRQLSFMSRRGRSLTPAAQALSEFMRAQLHVIPANDYVAIA